MKNSLPFGKIVRKPQGDFLTHTVYETRWLSRYCSQDVNSS